MRSPPAGERSPLVAVIVDFARALRAAGLTVGGDDILTCCGALRTLEPTDLVDLYWAGRISLVSRRDDIAVYDEVFRRFFLGADAPEQELRHWKAHTGAERRSEFEVPAAEPGDDDRQGEETRLGLMASNIETLQHKSFAACTREELAALRRIMARIRLTPPRRRTRRHTSARTGRRPDLRRIVRESLRKHGEPVEVYWQRRRVRPRPLILILDISGSMADYSRGLLQFAYSAQRAATRVEVFCFGTRLTCLTRSLRSRRPDVALDRATKAVLDWEGGTRIGDSLDRFVRGWGRMGVCRGGVVVICSDGLDRGDPEVLATAMERLSRLCHRIVWMNPHKGEDPEFRPASVGMTVAAPHIDLLLSGHDLASLEEFAELLPSLG